MLKEVKQSFDVTVVGAGVAGLMLTQKLAELGLQTALVEQEERVAGGPSTRNEGWLHRGTYHATSIADRSMAIQVARRCIYGHEQIKGFAPEAIEDVDTSSFAVVKDPERVSEITSRWDEAGVQYRRILPKNLLAAEPNLSIDDISEAFQAGDLGINTRLLYRKILTASARAGATVFTGSKLVMRDRDDVEVVQRGAHIPIDSSLFVYTAGYGVRDLLGTNLGVDIPLRYWKSHLMIFPRLTKSSVFCLDPKEAAMMNHDEYSIVGLNEDASRCEHPDYDVVSQAAENVQSATERLFKKVGDGVAVACIKTDLVEKTATARSLNISVSEPVQDHICVLPGKMTEAPYVTDVVTRMVYNRINDRVVALRPMDELRDSK